MLILCSTNKYDEIFLLLCLSVRWNKTNDNLKVAGKKRAKTSVKTESNYFYCGIRCYLNRMKKSNTIHWFNFVQFRFSFYSVVFLLKNPFSFITFKRKQNSNSRFNWKNFRFVEHAVIFRTFRYGISRIWLADSMPRYQRFNTLRSIAPPLFHSTVFSSAYICSLLVKICRRAINASDEILFGAAVLFWIRKTRFL